MLKDYPKIYKEIEKKIETLHSDDNRQLDVIFSDKNRIIVEAPAGYGKTRTIISRIAYLIASNQIFHPKKILTLTFSVNAAYKIKRDIFKELPDLFDTSISPLISRNKVLATNYHGFCRSVLKKYGYLIDEHLKNIDSLKGIDDDFKGLRMLGIKVTNDIKEVPRYSARVKKIDSNYLKHNMHSYLEKVKTYFLPKGYIPFNSILLFTLELFKEYPKILEFYKSYFPVIIVDEFQDTNILSWWLLKNLISDSNQLIFMGDSLQKIYGFIGVCPDIISKVKVKYGMNEIDLETNHRFKDNPLLLGLDKNIRENAKDIKNPDIENEICINVIKAQDQEQEAKMILDLVKQKLNSGKIAILVKQRGNNTNKILEIFNNAHLNYFNAIFSDEDYEYRKFHQKSLDEFIKIVDSHSGRNLRTISQKFFRRVKIMFEKESSVVYNSLLELLRVYLDIISKEYNMLNMDERIDFIKDTLENNALKQYLEYVNSDVIISTVHGAKGLEWDHVIISDMEKGFYPFSLCRSCKHNNCNIKWDICSNDFVDKYVEELNVFYVASTRARKEVYFSYSESGLEPWQNGKVKGMSCFLNLEGINATIIN